MEKRVKNLIIVKNIAIVVVALVFTFSISGSVLASDITSDNLLQIINQNRASNNLSPLKYNSDLDRAAALKSKDMVNRNYFDHYSHGLTPWDFMKISGYEYLYAGENLAMDFQTSEGMVNAWMNSPTHRDNILNPDYSDIGFGIVKGEFTQGGQPRETIMVTNMFGRKKPLIIKIFNIVSNNIFHIF